MLLLSMTSPTVARIFWLSYINMTLTNIDTIPNEQPQSRAENLRPDHEIHQQQRRTVSGHSDTRYCDGNVLKLLLQVQQSSISLKIWKIAILPDCSSKT